MAFKVEFNGVDLSTIVDGFTGITRNIGSGWTNFTNSGPFTGDNFLYNKKNSKTITVNFIVSVKDDRFVSVRNSLARVLNVHEPAALKFEDDPNQIWYAVPDGVPTLDESSFYQATGSITFLIPDGVSHSVDTKVVTASVVNGVMTAIVDNQGSDEMWPTYRIKNDKENGWNGIVHAGGLLEIGNRSETDTTVKKESQVILSTKDFSQFTQYTGTNIENSRKSNTGTAKTISENGQNFFRLDSSGTDNGYWHGASYVYDFPADKTGHVGSANVYAYIDMVMWASKFGQTGNVQVLFSDKDNNLVMGYDIYKTDTSGNSAIWTALTGDGKGGVQIKKVDNFETSHIKTKNPFSYDQGVGDIYKSGDTVRFYWKGSYPSFVVPELKNVEITKCYINLYQYADRSGDRLLRFMDLRNIIIRNDASRYIYDIKNRYGAGSEIVIDTESANIYVNGLPSIDDAVNPPDFAPLKPGKNTIEFYQSNWSSSKPKITVEYKERWL